MKLIGNVTDVVLRKYMKKGTYSLDIKFICPFRDRLYVDIEDCVCLYGNSIISDFKFEVLEINFHNNNNNELGEISITARCMIPISGSISENSQSVHDIANEILKMPVYLMEDGEYNNG